MSSQVVVATVSHPIPGGYRVETAPSPDQAAILAATNAALAVYDTKAAILSTAIATLNVNPATKDKANIAAVITAYTAVQMAYSTVWQSTKATSLAGDLVVIINLDRVTSKNALKAAWDQVLQIVSGSGTVAAS